MKFPPRGVVGPKTPDPPFKRKHFGAVVRAHGSCDADRANPLRGRRGGSLNWIRQFSDPGSSGGSYKSPPPDPVPLIGQTFVGGGGS